jgi:hypothetical protein
MYTAYITHAANATPNDANESNYGLQHIPYRPDGSGGLISLEVVGQQLGFRANPFKCNKNQEGSTEPPTPSGPFLVESKKDERIVIRTFVDQKTRDSDLSGKTAIVVATRFAGQLCTSSPGGGGDFNNQFYHEFVGSGNSIGGGAHPDLPTEGGGAHSMKLIGYPSKGTRHRAAVHERIGGGSRHSVLDGNGDKLADIVFRGTDSTTEDGIIRIKYSILPSVGNPNGSFVATKWFYDVNHHAPETQCTITASSHGSLSGNYTVANIPVASGQIYHLDWDAKSDGVIRGARLLLNGMILLADIQLGAVSSPSGLPGLVAWFEANDSLTITSGVTNHVSEWREKGGSTTISGVYQFNSSYQPLLVENSNNNLAGVKFSETNNEFLLGSGSPISSNDASTIFIVYEPSTLSSIDTIFSLSENVPSSGVKFNIEHMSVSISGTSDIVLESQDYIRSVLTNDAARIITLDNGGEINKTRLLVWRDNAFEGEGFIYPSGDSNFTDFIIDGTVESSGLSNTTLGRFSGAQISGVYNGEGQYFDGTIYEVAVYNRELNSTEIDRFRQYVENKYLLDI